MKKLIFGVAAMLTAAFLYGCDNKESQEPKEKSVALAQTDEQTTAPKTAPTESQLVSGSAWVAKVRDNLKNGKYAAFLKTEDQWYQDGLKDGKWAPLEEEDKQLLAKYNTPEGKKLFDEITSKVDKFETEIRALKKERNQALKQIADQYPQAPIAKLIKGRLDTPTPTDAQHQAVKSMDEWVSPFPLHAETPLLTQLKTLEREYQIKELLLEAAYSQGGVKNSKVPDFGPLDEGTLQEYQAALTLQKVERMQALADKTKEKDFINNLKLMSEAYPLTLAEIYDGLSIDARARDPKDEADKKVMEVLQQFNEKKNAILKKYEVGHQQ